MNLSTWRAGWRKPDRRSIAEWAHDHVTLPATYAQPGRFDVSTSRHMLMPFQAIQDETIREASWMGAIQTGKSLISEIAIAWSLCNSPGPTMLTMQTDEDAKEHCNQRFFEMLKSVPGIRAMIPDDRHKTTSTEIYFGPMFLMVNGANLTNLQRVSIRWKFNSECWLWKQGLLSHARGRVSAYEKAGNSKVINESQGGNEGDDFDLAWKAGNQQVWSVRCFGCGKLSPLEFESRMVADPTKRACVTWNEDARRTDGSWNVGRAVETCRWVCPQCGEAHSDTPATRARWNKDGDYLTLRPDADPKVASFRWESLVARDMGSLVAQFLEARKQQKLGLPQAMQDFVRQRRALPWKDELSNDAIVLNVSNYTLTDEKIAEKYENETARIMTIDKQKDHYWVIVRVIFNDGGSKLVYRSRVATKEQNREIQLRFDVPNPLVFEDSGYFPKDVYDDCAEYGWTALKGSGDNYFTKEVPDGPNRTKRIKRMWSDISRIQHVGKLIPLIHWCSDPVKDMLHALRMGRSYKWEVPSDVGEEYERQMKGEVKKEVVNKKTGRPEWRWFRKHANHYFDCEAMVVAASLMLNFLNAPTITNDDEKPDGQAPDGKP